jgi:DNA-binding HxlR family transcriptional regulator
LKRLRKTYGCPVELSLDLLGGKWKPVILARLKDRPLAYGELRALLPNLSDKMLTERLKELEEQGLTARETSSGNASRLRYGLTTRGETLRPVLQALYDWGEEAASQFNVQIKLG